MTFKLQRIANKYTAKRRINKRPDQQKYTLSRRSDTLNSAKLIVLRKELTLQDINTTPKEPKAV